MERYSKSSQRTKDSAVNEPEHIEQKALEFARKNKKKIACEQTDLGHFPADVDPVSVFMAGSPGAGKTESSIRLLEQLTRDGHNILRIDSDELRTLLPGYTGTNSHLFQGATSILADAMHDKALVNRQSFIFDGTLTNLARAKQNIQRSLARNRLVQIIYVYQDPIQAWHFVQAREKRDGRTIPIDAFVRQYVTARKNVDILKQEFEKKIHVDLVVKNIDGSDFLYRENVSKIDSHVPEKYDEHTLLVQLAETSM